MKYSYFYTFRLSIFFSLGLILNSYSIDRKSIIEVSTDDLLINTQLSLKGVSEDHTGIVWWLPNEFWESTYARDTTTSDKDKSAMLAAVEGVSLLGVVQADISPLGSFKFYPKEDVQKNMVITFTGKDGKSRRVPVEKDINPDLKVLLGIIKPMLAQAIGNMGENLHFFVLKDKDEDGNRILDPYEGGVLNFKLKEFSGRDIFANIYLPLNSLYVPRNCPNGRPADVTWDYCPWSGEKLD